MERLLQEIIDLMPVGVWVANRQGALVRMNSAAREIWRADPHANLGRFDTYKAWCAATGEEIKPGEWGLDRAIEDGSTSEELIRIQCFDGTERTVVNTAAPLHDEHGRLTGAVAVTEDVTELMAAQSLSHERGELLQTVQDLLPVGVLLFDAQGRLTEANPAARRIWGLDEHDPLPDLADFEAWDAATGEPVRPQAWASTHAVRTGETSRDQLLQIRTFNGSLRTIFNSAAPLRTLKARTAGAVAVNQDVSSLPSSSCAPPCATASSCWRWSPTTCAIHWLHWRCWPPRSRVSTARARGVPKRAHWQPKCRSDCTVWPGWWTIC